jgi:hypothetical protein
MNFRVGQRVVCVDDAPCSDEACRHNGIHNDEIYTIRSIERCPTTRRFGIRLEGITLPYHRALRAECMFRASRFRPVIDRKTDISIFHQIARDVENNVPARKETV